MADQQLTETDAARVEAVFTENSRFIENVARRYAFQADDVPDIVQAVGMQLCRKLHSFRGASEIKTWLYRVTVNMARDFVRVELKHQRSLEAVSGQAARDEEDAMLDPDAVVLASQRLDALRAASSQLRPHHRLALRDLVRNCAGLGAVSPEDGAMKEGTRKSRLFRARRELRSVLDTDPRFTD